MFPTRKYNILYFESSSSSRYKFWSCSDVDIVEVKLSTRNIKCELDHVAIILCTFL